MRALLALFLTGCLTPMASGDDTCLDFVEVAPREPGRVQYVVPIVDYDTQLTSPTPVPGTVLQICTNATCLPELPLCAGELGQCYRELPAPNPVVRVLDFPYGLSNVTIRARAEGYLSTDYPLGGPIIGAPDGSLTVRGAGIVLVKRETQQAIHAQVGAVADPLRGMLAVRVLGCGLQRQTDVDIETYAGDTRGATPFSLSTGNLASGGQLRTDQRGVVGFVNLPPQTLDIWAPSMDLRPATFNVRPDTLTLAEFRWGIDEFGQ